MIVRIVLVATLGLSACGPAQAPAPGPVDSEFLLQDQWNDGRAEIAFYQVERSRNQYGQEQNQSFSVGTYVVKHDFDSVRMSKARPDAIDPVSAFKYALFYEVQSGSYEYKRNWVVNSRQEDLRPLKASYSSFDWCSNSYREMAVGASGQVDVLVRTDDYGNEESSFAYSAASYPIHALPMLVRALDFAEGDTLDFSVMLETGDAVPAVAVLAGTDSVSWPGGVSAADRIDVRYSRPVPSMIAETSDAEESYWRGTSPDRRLLKVEGQSGRYTMTLVELIRSPYWSENFWPLLERVEVRP